MGYSTHRHRRNGLGARNDNGDMVCAVCGQGYDERPIGQIATEDHGLPTDA